TRWNYALKLQELSARDFEKIGIHARIGEISIFHILQLLVTHDAQYLEEIRERIEMATEPDEQEAEH
ncbi:MAG TPA: hypothetical protein VGM92_08985, partial [Candidatus Kapabacteria bacterium]